MKLFISLLLTSFGVQASTIVIYDASKSGFGQLLQERFLKKHQIPAKLARLYQVEQCPAPKESSNQLILCANKKRLEILNSNPSIIKSLAVFKRGAE